MNSVNKFEMQNKQMSFDQVFSQAEICKVEARNPIIGVSPKFVLALQLARKCSTCSSNVFIGGESGAGKEVFAKYIHETSHRKNGPFIAINCSAIPENLLESELFGHAKGAFTGANDKKVGLFEEAENGTLFLDEIGDLCLSLQAKLLRVLQEKKIKRVGENQYRSINCRIISASHKNLMTEVNEKKFREDLYFRLNVIPLNVPPLRERPEDIMLLADFFLNKFIKENKCGSKYFADEAKTYIQTNPWRGNVRELENAVERAVILSSGPVIHRLDFEVNFGTEALSKVTTVSDRAFTMSYSGHLPSLSDVIHSYIVFAVNTNNGARDKTAKDIGIDRKTLYRRLDLA